MPGLASILHQWPIAVKISPLLPQDATGKEVPDAPGAIHLDITDYASFGLMSEVPGNGI